MNVENAFNCYCHRNEIVDSFFNKAIVKGGRCFGGKSLAGSTLKYCNM